jgi:hypothetical protein
MIQLHDMARKKEACDREYRRCAGSQRRTSENPRTGVRTDDGEAKRAPVSLSSHNLEEMELRSTILIDARADSLGAKRR